VILCDRVVLVTGSGRGAGVGIARSLARQGATVAVNYATSADGARAVVDEIEASGGKARAYQTSVLDTDAVADMVGSIESDFGRLDGVVNNAIAGVQGATFADATFDDYRDAFDYGCRAVVNTARAALPVFARAGGGRIVNVVTDFWNSAPPEWSVYLAGKGALVGLSRSLAGEFGPLGVTVNMVAPGWMVADEADENSDDSREFSAKLPLRRRARPEDVGDVIAFYLSDLAASVTGAYLVVNGGRNPQVGT
jgi:3-oxoacyl-[acyl-carrier protein] reductase